LITTEVYAEEREKKEDEISRAMSEIVLQQASEHDFKPNWLGQADQSIGKIVVDDVQTPPSLQFTPHGLTQRV
jgi:hypothetical protein